MSAPPAKIRTTIYLSPEVWQQARLAAIASNRSTSSLIESLLEAYLWSNNLPDKSITAVDQQYKVDTGDAEDSQNMSTMVERENSGMLDGNEQRVKVRSRQSKRNRLDENIAPALVSTRQKARRESHESGLTE